MSVSAVDSRIFRNLFGTEEIRKIFDDNAYVECMIKAEKTLAKAQAKLGVIPKGVGEFSCRSVRCRSQPCVGWID